MIRLTALLRRNHELSADEFRAHWRDVHAGLVSGVPHVNDWVMRYEQHPRLEAPGQWTGTRGFDGMAVQWFRSIDDLHAMTQDVDYRQMVGPDERHLLDLQRSVYLVTDEPRIVIGES